MGLLVRRRCPVTRPPDRDPPNAVESAESPSTPTQPHLRPDHATLAETRDPIVAIRFEQVSRWSAGDRVPAEEFASRTALSDEDVLVLVMSEVELRRAAGETPTVAEY